jgi:hypothetical protein
MMVLAGYLRKKLTERGDWLEAEHVRDIARPRDGALERALRAAPQA